MAIWVMKLEGGFKFHKHYLRHQQENTGASKKKIVTIYEIIIIIFAESIFEIINELERMYTDILASDHRLL